MNEKLSRSLLAAEAVVLLLPLTALYGLLFAILFPNLRPNEFGGNPSFIIGTLLAGAGLVALWRLLATAVVFGIEALRRVPNGWMLFCLLIGLWVLLSWLVLGLDPRLNGALSRNGMEGIILGIYGLPALVPLLHLAAELRWRKQAA